MSKFLLRYRGTGPGIDELPALVEEEPTVRIVDSFNESFVVEGTSTAIRHLIANLRGWFSAPVKSYSQPKIGAARHGRVSTIRQ